jgi:hypothetical protein
VVGAVQRIRDLVAGAAPTAPTPTDFTSAAPGVTSQIVAASAVAGTTRTGAPKSVRVYRLGADGADTYGSDAQFIGLRIVRAS